jgi:beta-galactosidase GanA
MTRRVSHSFSGLLCLSLSFAAFLTISLSARASEAPRIEQKDGRYTLLVDGRPFLILGGQIHNSSAWPSELPQVWQSMEALHANTIEAPVYWEQFEPREGQFDYTNVDQLVEGARAHNLHAILLWFGTWKNGNMHYVPAWVKNDPRRFPHTVRPDGEPIDVLSPNSRSTLEADKAAFLALMRHLKQIDGDAHTVLLIQVENESGNIGSVRDNSAEANREFAGAVPADLLAAAHKQPGAWPQVFGAEADEVFQLYHQAKYINEIAAAGKKEFDIPCYINVWIDYPAAQLPQRQLDTPGIAYPSGGAVQKFVALWRALAPSLDAIGPDIYTTDSPFYRATVDAYHRPDNPLLIPETGRGDAFAKFFFYALGEGAIGFAPFGVDQTGWNILGDTAWKSHSYNFSLIGPMDREIAQLEFDGKVKTAVEEPGKASEEVDFGDWQATVSFGFPQPDGRPAPGTKDAHGAALIAQLGPDEFLVSGVDASVVFHLPGKLPWIRSQIVTAEQGAYEAGKWHAVRLWNGDETDRGLSFHQRPEVVRVTMGRF